MKQVKRILGLILMFSFLMSMTSFAEELTWESASGHHNLSVLLPSTETSAKDTVYRNARGDYLSSGSVEIVNLQNGNIRINVETYAHRNVDMIQHAVFLDQWDETEEDWVQINYWEFQKYKEEENNELSYFSTSFTVSGYPTNKYYRLRGLHAVELGDEIEACASETNGILITNTSN